MQRHLQHLAAHPYDVLIVGGGIYGACMAWEAVSRGLSVALVEQGDFGAATSANSLKIIHGGLRYLQHADFKRMRESICERRNLLRIAPHLVHPLPILVPTYGHGVKGREAMAIALKLNDIISCDRNWAVPDPAQQIPAGRVISAATCLEALPGLDPDGLTGGATFADAQVYNSERLTLAFLQSASAAGAQVANYARVTGFLREGDRLAGATVRDELSGAELTVRARLIINTAGPWIHRLQDLAGQGQGQGQGDRPMLLAKAVNLVVPRFIEHYAVGLSSRHAANDPDAVVKKGSRFLFTVPWRDASMVGTWYFPYRQSPDDVSVTPAELQTCIDDINAAYPAAQLSLADITFVHCGLLPSSGIAPQTGEVQLAKHYQVIDHRHHGLPGLVTVAGVKYTTARDVAEKVINQVGRWLDRPLAPSQTAQTPLHGGNLDDLNQFIQRTQARYAPHLSAATVQQLVYTYGTDSTHLLAQAAESAGTLSPRALLAAQVRHAVQSEMAYHLADVVLRRTDLGSAGVPPQADIELCAEVMAQALGWDGAQRQAEVQQLAALYRQKLPTCPPQPLTSGV
ncbi:MAG TPA: glycerol-3-phosphate dehydrogenase/oxidase [Candidatus Obscuribacterales bacterium]